MFELIEQLRQLCRDNEDSGVPVLVIEHVLRSCEAKLAYQHGLRRISDGQILRDGTGGPYAEFLWARGWAENSADTYELVRRVVAPEQTGEWGTFQ